MLSCAMQRACNDEQHDRVPNPSFIRPNAWRESWVLCLISCLAGSQSFFERHPVYFRVSPNFAPLWNVESFDSQLNSVKGIFCS